MATRATTSASVCVLLTGACLGAIAMYYFDPHTGRRRRARIRDQLARAKNALADMQQAKGSDLVNRASGLFSRLLVPLRSRDNSNDALNARVRSKLGRLVKRPHAIDASADAGCVVLRGEVLNFELARVIHEIRRIPGVREVDNRLTLVDQFDSIATHAGRPGHMGG